jgi:hypothetical protein
MNETTRQYIERITSYVEGREPRTVLEQTPERLRALVSSASPAELAWTATAARWSITQVAAHLADAEIVGAWRFRAVLETDNVTIQAYDQATWSSAFHYEQTDPVESVALFGALRRSTLALLKRVDPERLAHAGLHQERGRESVEHLMRMFAGHDLNHLAQIERLLSEAREQRS